MCLRRLLRGCYLSLNLPLSNTPLEWTGRHQLSASLPQAPCLPLRGSVRQAKQPVARPYLAGYTEACLKSGRRLPMPRGLLPCVTGLQGLVSTSGSDGSPLVTQEIFAPPVGDGVSELRIHYSPGHRIYLTKQGDAVVILLVGGDKSSQDKDIRFAKELARNL